MLAGAAFSLQAQTIQQAMEQAVRRNPEVLAAASRRLAANEGLRQARGGYLPRVDLIAGVGKEQIDDRGSRLTGTDDSAFSRHDAALTLSQMLFDGLAVQNEVARQQARIESSAFGVAATAEDVALRTAATYLEVLRRQETVTAATENLAAHQHHFDQITALAEGGVGRRADIEQTRGRLASASAILRAEQSSLRDSELAFLRLVGEAPRALSRPDMSHVGLPQSEDAALAAALQDHPAIRAAQADVDLANALQSAARAALSPRVDLELSARRSRDAIDGKVKDLAVMLRLRYNLFRGGSDAARVAEAGHQAREAGEVLNRVQAQVEEAVALAYNADVAARDRLNMLRQYVESSVATRDAYIKQFGIGQRTLVDLLNAENEYFNARFAYITGDYLALTSLLRIQAGVGRLLPSWRIALPPEAALPTNGSGSDD